MYGYFGVFSILELLSYLVPSFYKQDPFHRFHVYQPLVLSRHYYLWYTAFMPSAFSHQLLSSSGIAALYTSMVDSGFSPDERRVGARAILRHRLHQSDQSITRKENGLHPMYTDLHGRGDRKGEELDEIKRVLKDSFGDVVEAVSTYPILPLFSFIF